LSKFWTALAQEKIILLCDPYPINLPDVEIDVVVRDQ